VVPRPLQVLLALLALLLTSTTAQLAVQHRLLKLVCCWAERQGRRPPVLHPRGPPAGLLPVTLLLLLLLCMLVLHLLQWLLLLLPLEVLHVQAGAVGAAGAPSCTELALQPAPPRQGSTA
jgi:hypothetical protein